MEMCEDFTRVDPALEACVLQRLATAAVLNLVVLEDCDRFGVIDGPIHDASFQFVFAHVSHWIDSVYFWRQVCRPAADTL